MEHRWGQRLTVSFPARIAVSAFNVREGRLKDLSVSGAFIEGELDLRPLSHIKVAIMAPQWQKHDVHTIHAYVARKYRNGVGVEWCEFAPPIVSDLLQQVVQRPHALLRHQAHARTGIMITRLSGPLLKHSA